MAFHLGPRMRRVLRYAGFALLALVTFVFALQLTFPYDRVKAKIVEALDAKYDVTIGGVERGILPGRMTFQAVTLRTRPTEADQIATTFFVERLEVSLGLFALVRGAASVDLDAKIGPGHITGNLTISKQGTEIDLVGKDLPSASLPMREALGLPMSGKVGFSVDLELPNQTSKQGRTSTNWQKATGSIGFDCPGGCTFGDGKAKLKPKLKNSRNQAFAADGIDFGKINVDSMLVRVTLKKGQLELSRFETASQDGELHVDFAATLAPQFNESMVAGCLRFKGSDGLRKREPTTHAALTTTGASLGPDDLFHIRLDGKFRDMKRLAQTCGPAIKDASTDNPGADSRPNLTVQPPDPTLTGSATPPPPPPPAPEPVVIDAAVPPPSEPAAPSEKTVDERAGEAADGQPVPPGEAVAPADRAPGTDDNP